MKTIYFAIFGLLVSCGETNINTENRRTNQGPKIAAKESKILPVPSSAVKAESPFVAKKVWLPEKDTNLNSQKEKITVIHKNEEPCLSELPQISGYLYQQNVFGKELNEAYSVFDTYEREDLLSLAKDACVIGVVLDSEQEANFPKTQPASGLNLVGNQVKEAVGYADSEVNGFLAGFSTKAKVAIIDTGVDLKSTSLKNAIAKDLRTTSYYTDEKTGKVINGDIPQDEHGHGTEVASILGHEDFGLLNDHVEIFPIKITQNGYTKLSMLLTGISMAVNKGVDIINLSMGGHTNGCNPLVGHAIYRGIEKGVLFVVSAGNGIENASGDQIGFPIVAARDDGPADYSLTDSPACWSKYFLGAVAVAAKDHRVDQMATFSNFGDEVELSAPGVDIKTSTLQEKISTAKGTSFSAPFGTAAAALAVAHHRHHGFRIGPWYLENLLIESSKRDPYALEKERRVRFGSEVNFRNMIALLKRTEKMTEDQRRNDIRTINPRQGEGWEPGEDTSNLKALTLALNPGVMYPGEEFNYKTVAFYRHGNEKDVTLNPNTTVSLSDKERLAVNAGGKIKVADASKFDFKNQKEYEMTVTVGYLEDQAQIFASQKIIVKNPSNKDDVRLTKIEITPPSAPVRVWQNFNVFKAIGHYSNGETYELTDSATWTSSRPEELRPTEAAGVFNSNYARASATYRIIAQVGDVQGIYDVNVVDEEVVNFYIHNYLGQGGKVQVGQKVVLEPRLVLSEGRERPMEVRWRGPNGVLNNDIKSSRLEIDTTKMSIGQYTYTVLGVFYRGDSNVNLAASITLDIEDGVQRIEIHLKQPVVSENNQFQLDVRAYRENNSYIVVTEETQWSSSDETLLMINDKGIAFANRGSGGKSYRISANYKGHLAQVSVAVVNGSVVTGSTAEISNLALSMNSLEYCSFPQRNLSRCYCQSPTPKISAYYKDGTVRDVPTANYSVSEKTVDNAYSNAVAPYYGDKTYRVSATYNDGSIDSGGGGNATISAEFAMPVTSSSELCDYDPRLVSEGRVLPEMCVNGNSLRLKLGNQFLLDNPVILRRNIIYQSSAIDVVDVCSLSSVSIEPAVGLEVSSYGNRVNFDANGATVGTYRLTIVANYTGGGADEQITRVVTVNVTEAEPQSIVVAPKNELGGVLPYGENQFSVRLYTADDPPQEIRYDPADIEFSLFDSNSNAIDTEKSNGLYLDQSGTVGLFPNAYDAQYKLKAVYKPTSFSGEYAFRLAGTDKIEEPKVTGLSQISEPSANTSVDSVCSGVNPVYDSSISDASASFSGGLGTAENPLVICSANQLLHLNEYCKLDSQICAGDLYFELGQNVDFNSAMINAIKPLFYSGRIHLDGKNHSVSNFVIIDSEKSNMGLFERMPREVRNLILVNPTVRGSRDVGALAGSGTGILENVHVKNGVVWGLDNVGGLVGSITFIQSANNVGNYGTTVQYEGSSVGGIFGVTFAGASSVNSAGEDNRFEVKNTYMTGKVAPAGVPGYTKNIGGIVGDSKKTSVRNAIVTGDLITLNAYLQDTNVGGVVGQLAEGFVLDSSVTGNIVSTGSGVGGIVGKILGTSGNNGDPSSGAFGLSFNSLSLPLIQSLPSRFKDKLLRKTGVLRSTFAGSVWAGMSLKTLECSEDTIQIIGRNGGETCTGQATQSGGYSNAGGIVGVINSATIQENVVNGTIRGVRAVGGIAGQAILGNFIQNQVSGVVSASQGGSEYGALVGLVSFLKDKIPSRFVGNQFTPSSSVGQWAVGNNGGKLQVVNISAEPHPFPQ